MINQQIQQLIDVIRQLPGVGTRSARKIALHLLGKDTNLAQNIICTLRDTMKKIRTCHICHNVDITNPCHICSNRQRNHSVICVVEQVLDLWSMEKFSIHQGVYHVLGGVLSVANNVGPDELNLRSLWKRLRHGDEEITEIILALNATTESNITAFYLVDNLKKYKIKISVLGRGIPMGGELDYLDEGTISEAFKARRLIS